MHIDILKMITPIPLKYKSKSTICTKCNIEDRSLNELESDVDDMDDDIDGIETGTGIEKHVGGEVAKPVGAGDDVADKAGENNQIALVVKRAVKKLVADTTARNLTG